MNEARIRQLAEAVTIADRHDAYDGHTVFRYAVTPYPEFAIPAKVSDPNLTIAERIAIAVDEHNAQAGLAGWTVLLWNDPDENHRIRAYGQNTGTYWMHWNSTVRRARQILDLDEDTAHQLFATKAAANADGITASAVLRHLAETGTVDWQIAVPPAPSGWRVRPDAEQLRCLRVTEAKSRQALDDFLNARPELKQHMTTHYRPPGG